MRDEGEKNANWNMRMAYAYQYLMRQEEKAIEYAKRWAELDPEDSSAKEVIEECMEEISKRENSSNVKESDTVEPCATSNTHIETRETENIELRDKKQQTERSSSGCNDSLALALAGVGT